MIQYSTTYYLRMMMDQDSGDPRTKTIYSLRVPRGRNDSGDLQASYARVTSSRLPRSQKRLACTCGTSNFNVNLFFF